LVPGFKNSLLLHHWQPSTDTKISVMHIALSQVKLLAPNLLINFRSEKKRKTTQAAKHSLHK
jgi:hypothetical protein